MHDTNLIQEPFYHDRIVLVCSPENELAKRRGLKFSDIEGYDFLLREKVRGRAPNDLTR